MERKGEERCIGLARSLAIGEVVYNYCELFDFDLLYVSVVSSFGLIVRFFFFFSSFVCVL